MKGSNKIDMRVARDFASTFFAQRKRQGYTPDAALRECNLIVDQKLSWEEATYLLALHLQDHLCQCGASWEITYDG